MAHKFGSEIGERFYQCSPNISLSQAFYEIYEKEFSKGDLQTFLGTEDLDKVLKRSHFMLNDQELEKNKQNLHQKINHWNPSNIMILLPKNTSIFFFF